MRSGVGVNCRELWLLGCDLLYMLLLALVVLVSWSLLVLNERYLIGKYACYRVYKKTALDIMA